ncbi:OsmC family protein [Phaeocystidibacter luteus]|uniref:OsmC family protein n=1 Tax=Phaeocystidibacter luteus TaxID=911197 RepID=A0A6N6RJG1_9FLAO|nr:OsmC family protein [Phaeocystidibacter luteus]KAB2814194.1 OsmC family protein [Phaeocystidibacter luteus]
MEIARIDYEGNLHCNAIHLKSGKEIETDAPTDNNGKGEAFSPTDLMSTSLGLCMITIMGIKARDMNIDLAGTSISVGKVMASNPRRVAEIHLRIEVPTVVSARDRDILEAAGKACPVAKSLHPDVLQAVEFEWASA